MPGIIIICNNRAERGPLESVVSALPEATILGLTQMQQRGPPAKVLGWALWWFNREFEERKPDLVVVVGDRYETLGAVQAAYFLRIPVAHIHGGETTTGAFDDAVRDAITRMSALHFVANDHARHRVFALQSFGTWSPDIHADYAKIHLTGAPGLDGIQPQSARRDRKLILVTYHPETRAPDFGVATCREMLTALDTYTATHEILFMGVNNDPGCDDIRNLMFDWVATHPTASFRSGVDHAGYVALMQAAVVVVGNSSAAIIEAPWVGCPSVNIGGRQDGRPMPPSVIQAPRAENIQHAIATALSFNGPWEPCYLGGAAPRIAKICREFLQHVK